MRKFLLLFLFILPYFSFSQEYIYVSKEGVRQLLRVNMAYTQWTIKPGDSSANSANGVHLLNEVKIVSAFWNSRWAVTVHDAFYFDINLGLLSGKPRLTKDYPGSFENEHTFSYASNFGYLFLAGYRTKKWAALAGIDYRWFVGTAGSYDMSGDPLLYTRPFVFRGELCVSKSNANRRAIGMFWHDSGTSGRIPYQGFRLEIPIDEDARWFFLAQYTKLQSSGTDNFMNASYPSMNFSQFMIGFRIQNALL